METNCFSCDTEKNTALCSECKEGYICRDCAFECGKCGKGYICINCSSQCDECEKTICNDCLIYYCGLCDSYFCVDDLKYPKGCSTCKKAHCETCHDAGYCDQ